MNYIYRAVTGADLHRLCNGMDIGAPGLCYGLSYKFEDYLYEISTHILSGNTKTMWISLSRDYNTCYKKYSNNGNHDNTVRNNVIAVREDANYTIVSSEYSEDLFDCLSKSKTDEEYHKYLDIIYNLDPAKIDKVVFNISIKGSIQALADAKLIKSKRLKNPNYNHTIQNYATCDKEVLMFKNIKNSDIAYILSPLEMDLLYAISKIEGTDVTRDIDRINDIKTFLNKYPYIQDYQNYGIFYRRNLTIVGYYDACKYTRSDNDFFAEYISMKKSLLRNILLSYYHYLYKKNPDIYKRNPDKMFFGSKKNIPIIEDEKNVFSKSKDNYNKAVQDFDEYLASLCKTSGKRKIKELI